MRQRLEEIRTEVLGSIAHAANGEALEELRVRYLGKKGELTAILKQMGKLMPEERPVIGQLANEVRADIEEKFEAAVRAFERGALESRLRDEKLDVTIPGVQVKLGHRHPLNTIIEECEDIFVGMGFEIIEGPEVEMSDYVFTKLNTPHSHSSRDRSDTFYVVDDDSVCLRTQTSSMQVRAMETMRPPLRIISHGRVYRKDEVDATHSPMFHQIEGLVVDRGVTMADLKGTLNTMVRRLYGEDAKTRFRPHHFPFTEPSCEVDVMCFECKGEGCRVCKGEGWIELLGAGMVHPKVLQGCGIDTDIYTGFAFGIGVERLAMRRFNISDMRLLFENDLRFLRQF